MFLLELTKAFQNENLNFVILGGYAVALHGVNVPIASIDDLIKIKEAAGRPQDIEDVKALKLLRKQNV
jgi:predicted nucleotidyltransferase